MDVFSGQWSGMLSFSILKVEEMSPVSKSTILGRNASLLFFS